MSFMNNSVPLFSSVSCNFHPLQFGPSMPRCFLFLMSLRPMIISPPFPGPHSLRTKPKKSVRSIIEVTSLPTKVTSLDTELTSLHEITKVYICLQDCICLTDIFSRNATRAAAKKDSCFRRLDIVVTVCFTCPSLSLSPVICVTNCTRMRLRQKL